MDLAMQGVLIIATFALAHERFIEFLRWWIDKLPSQAARDLLDGITQGPWAWLPAVGLSIATHANALDAFQLGGDHQPLFFTSYLSGVPHDPRAILGCCFMGLAVTLGSSFWHDLARGLIDVRGRLQDARQPGKLPAGEPGTQLAQAVLPAAPPVPAATGLVLA